MPNPPFFARVGLCPTRWFLLVVLFADMKRKRVYLLVSTVDINNSYTCLQERSFIATSFSYASKLSSSTSTSTTFTVSSASVQQPSNYGFILYRCTRNEAPLPPPPDLVYNETKATYHRCNDADILNGFLSSYIFQQVMSSSDI